MAVVQIVKSGIVQTVVPEQRNETIQYDPTSNGELVKGKDIAMAGKDADSPLAIPDVPTTEAPYDGQVCFGVFLSDEAGNG